MTDLAPVAQVGWFSARLRAVRAFTMPLSMMPVPLAAAAALPVSKWNWPVLVACAIGVGMLHCVGNMLNDVFDFRSGVDRKTEGNEKRPGLVLVKGYMNPREVLAEIAVCTGIAAACTAYVTWVCGWGVLVFGSLAAVSIYIYTGPPLELKYHALGEVLIFITFGPLLLLGAAYAQTLRLEFSAFLVSIPAGLATTAVLVGNNVRDRDEDSQAGITTLSHVIGHRWLGVVYIFCMVSAAIITAILAAFGLLPRVLLAAPVLLLLVARPIASIIRDQRVPDIDAQTARYVGVLLIAMTAALIAA